jgi:hypothetical protein
MASSKKIRITIFNKDNSIRNYFTGRLIGFANDAEYRAVLNTDGAAKKVFTSPSVLIKDIPVAVYDKRIVIATSERLRGAREIFISSAISYMSYIGGSSSVKRKFRCKDGKDYLVEEI